MAPIVVKPLSVIQQTMWLEHQLAPQSASYNLVLPIRIRSPLDARALEGAVELVGLRHELLRSRFLDHDGEPCRRPADGPLTRLEILDVPAAELATAIRSYVNQPFDLTEGAFRVGLLRLSADDAVLLPVAHHIASDFVSHWLIVRDLLDAYRHGKLSVTMTFSWTRSAGSSARRSEGGRARTGPPGSRARRRPNSRPTDRARQFPGALATRARSG